MPPVGMTIEEGGLTMFVPLTFRMLAGLVSVPKARGKIVIAFESARPPDNSSRLESPWAVPMVQVPVPSARLFMGRTTAEARSLRVTRAIFIGGGD